MRLVLLVAAVAAAIAGCGGNAGSSSQSGTAQGGSGNPRFAGLATSPRKPAPALSLRDSLGHHVDLRRYNGKAVLVTFIYDHCPDTCPLIVGNLRTAQSLLGSRARRLQIVAVSVDPRGDTPRTVNAFLRKHRMTGRMEYLIGSRPQLERVWSDWGIASRNGAKSGNPNEVEHSALIYGIGADGRMSTLYPANFKPAQVVHDVPILASQ